MSHHGRLIQALFAADLPAARLTDWVLDFVRREEMFRPGDRVLVAVSGGPDSVALLHLLVGWRQELGLELGVGHFDHGLRGRESADDAAFVAELAQELHLPYHQGRGDVKELARTHRLSRQMAARRLRLDFLQDTCRTQGYDNFPDVLYFFQFLHNALQGISLQFTIKRWQNKSYWTLQSIPRKLCFDLFDICSSKSVKGCHYTGLIEIRHTNLLHTVF